MTATMQGVYITVLGMAILFAALLILMLAAMGLERLFRPKEREDVPVRPEETPSSEREKGLVAAIAVAIALKLQSPISNIQYPTTEEAVSAWKFWGRYRQLTRSREAKGYRR